MIKLIVDGKEISSDPEMSVLQACLQNGIFIPNLCFVKTRERPHASCRLCFVEIDGFPRPVPSCAEKVSDGSVVKTDTPAVKRLQRMGFKLLMSGHPCEPKGCPVKGNCQLIRISKHLKVALNPKPLELLEREIEREVDLTYFTYYPFRCVLCGKCVHACREKNGYNLLTFAERGFDTVIALFPGSDPTDHPCKNCLACTTVCPTGAIIPKNG